MRKFSYITLPIALLAMVVYLCSCAVGGGGIVDPSDPLTPSPEIKEGTVDPSTRAITISKEDITVTSEHWSKKRVDRKYSTVDMRSPFFYLETWAQSFQTDVFHVTITNNSPREVLVVFKETTIEDEREYLYKPTQMDFFTYKFRTKKMMDLKTKRGLEEARYIVLSEVIGPKRAIAPGQTVSGFIPFTVPSTQAHKVWLTLTLEKEPDLATKSYERIQFRFDYVQDLVLRARQN